jgi:phage gp46-like protein
MNKLGVPRLVNVVEGDAVSLDLLLDEHGLLDETQAFATALIVTFGTHRRAEPDDVLPDPDAPEDRRGWWGDTEAAEIWDGWPIGWRGWLKRRAKITGPEASEGSLQGWLEAYALEAMEPYVERGMASNVVVSAERIGINRIDLHVTVYRGDKPAIELRYQDLWPDDADRQDSVFFGYGAPPR